MKFIEYLRRQLNQLISFIAKKTGLSETRTRRVSLFLLALLISLCMQLALNFLADQRVPPVKVPEVKVDAIVKGHKDIKQIDIYGSETAGNKVTLYVKWNDGRTTITTMPRFAYGSLEYTVLMPQGLPIAYKPNEEKPGAYPAYEGFKGALIAVGQSANALFSILLLVMMMRAMGFVGSNRFTVILPNAIEGSMDDLVGIEDIKDEVNMLGDLYENRSVFAEHGIKRAWNILFSGPAGVGKTKLSSYLAKRLGVPLLFIDGARLEDGFVGGGSRTLHKLHKKASSFGRCIVFIDEGQALLMRRGGNNRSRFEDDTPNTLLSILDGVRTRKDSEIIWIIASNFDQHNSTMDEAVLRRFQLKVNFRLPNLDERLAMLERFIAKRAAAVVDDNINLTTVAQASAGLSPAHLELITDQASLIAIREKVKLDSAILLRALERTVIGLADRAQTGHRQQEREIVAAHETGHFLAAVSRYADGNHTLAEAKQKCDTIKISTEAVSSIGALGFALSNAPEVKLFTQEDLEWQIRTLYGGRAAEDLVFGQSKVTTGAANDIDRVTEILVQMVGAYGMCSRSPVNLLKYRGNPGAIELNVEEQDIVQRRANTLYHETYQNLRHCRNALDRIRSALMERYTLDKDELFALLAEDWPAKRSTSDQAETVSSGQPQETPHYFKVCESQGTRHV